MTAIPASLKKVYGETEGPLGFPMFDAEAKALDNLWKSLPTSCRDMGLMHLGGAAKALDAGEDNGDKWDIAFVTTDSLDRDREVLVPKGADWKSFKKNPVVTFAHDYTSLPLGRAAWWKLDTKAGVEGWLAKTIFKRPYDGHVGPWFPYVVHDFIKDKMMPGNSVGFIALEYRPPEEKEIKANPSWAKARGVVPKYLVLEYAKTPVQSNPDCITTQVSKMLRKGIKLPDEMLERFGLMMPDEIPSTTEGEQDPPLPSPPPAIPVDPATAVLATADDVAKSAKGLAANHLMNLARAVRVNGGQ